MIHYSELQFNDPDVYKRRGKHSKPYSDTIYTFDIETTSLFYINDKWQTFDYNLYVISHFSL